MEILPAGASLRFGVPGSQLPARDPGRAARLAEEAGFDSVWWADRLMGWLPDGPHALLDPVPVMAASAVATTRVHLGTAVADPLRRGPAQLVQTALTLQQISGGRVLLGVGCGEVAGTRPYGIAYDRPVGRFEEALAAMRALMASEGRPVTFEGRDLRLTDALCGLAATVAAPPIWVAAHGPRMLRITGEQGDGWLPTAHGPRAYADQLVAIRTAALAAGRTATAVEPGCFIWVVGAGSRARARELLATAPLRALGLLLPGGALASSPLREGPWAHLVPTDPRIWDLVAAIDVDELATLVPHGTPADIARDVGTYVDAGARHLVLCDMAAASGEDTGLGLRAHEVHAAVRDAVLRERSPA